MAFKKQNVDNLTLKQYIEYYDQALLSWENKEVSNKDMRAIMDEFNIKSYSIITYLMRNNTLIEGIAKNIHSNATAIKYADKDDLLLIKDDIQSLCNMLTNITNEATYQDPDDEVYVLTDLDMNFDDITEDDKINEDFYCRLIYGDTDVEFTDKNKAKKYIESIL